MHASLWPNVSWGTAWAPDLLLHTRRGRHVAASEHQAIDACLQAVGGHLICQSRCLRTLGCTAWTWLPGGRCCLRQWRPLGSTHIVGAFAGVNPPCTQHCSAARPVQQFFGPAPRRIVTSADAGELPWIHVAGGRPPEPQQDADAIHSSAGRVAVCMAGQVRTLVHPAVWHALRDRVLERGEHDLFAVLGTGSSKRAELPRDVRAETGAWPDRAPDSCALEVALGQLQPKAVRFVLSEPRQSPCHDGARQSKVAWASLQFAKWAACVGLVRRHEQQHGVQYDWLFKTRPDVYWREPLHLGALAGAMPGPDVVLTVNDMHALVHRSRFHVIDAMESIACDIRCNGASPYLRGLFHSFNEYCLLLMHLSRFGVRQLEASHPWESALLHFVGGTNWTAGLRLRHRRPRLARFRQELSTTSSSEERTVCSYRDRRVGTAPAGRHRVTCWKLDIGRGAVTGHHDMIMGGRPTRGAEKDPASRDLTSEHTVQSSPKPSERSSTEATIDSRLEYLAWVHRPYLPDPCRRSTQGVGNE